jgi:glycine betaine catabolism B
VSAVVRFNSALGRVPMLVLVLWWLVLTAVLAIVLSAFGVVGYAPAALIASLVVSVAVSWLATKVLGSVLRAPTHGSASVVTGLIIFFLFFPSAQPVDLLLLAATCIVGAVSKFVLTWHGRHLFNPAAVAILIAGLVGGYDGWWVATGPLLPVVAVGALLVLVRLRMLGTGVLFMAVATLGSVVGQRLVGGEWLTALSNALVLSPIVFLGGFMLSEPITLPARRWQRLTEAAIVGVLFAMPYLAPFHLGPFGWTPELALLLGNVFSVVVAPPLAARLRFAGRRSLTATSTEFSFTAERPIVHRAGQYLELQLPHRGADRRGIRRTLTIVSAPDAPSGEVQVALRTRQPLSTFKQALDQLPVGSPLRAVTVSGGFTLPRDRRVPLVLVASGIGITPFVSQLRAEIEAVAGGAAPRDILAVVRVSSPEEIVYADVLEASGVRVLLVCPDPAALTGMPDHWHVAARLDAETLGAVLPGPTKRVAYVSGSPKFLSSAKRVLRAVGVRRIRTDAFSGY